MATAIQRRRGTSLQHANFTGLAGEITIDTTLNTIIVHDGVTAGGVRLAKYSEVQAASEGDITAVNTLSGSGLTGGVASGQANIAIDYENLQGNLIPSADNTYSLGSPTKVWKDVYVGPGSLYVNGQKVLEDNSGTIVVGADAGQNLALNTSGGGDIEFNAIGGGTIALKSNVVVSSGISFSSAGGNTVGFNSNINLTSNQINNLGTPVSATDAATKAYVDTASDIVRTSGAQTIAGDKTFSDNLVVGGSLTVQGTTTTVNSETISLADNIIDLNSNFTSGNPTENAGIRIQRGDEAAVQLRWNEASDQWEVYDGTATTKIALDTDDLAEGSTNLYYTSARANADFDTKLAAADTDDVAEGASNLYFTNARADARIALQTGASLDLSSKDTDDLSEGSTNQYHTTARARGAISAGGDLSYNSTTGVMSFTQRTDAQVRSLISATGDISYDQTTGVISFTNDAGDIESVTAGAGLSGGGASGDVSLAVDLADTSVFTSTNTASRAVVRDASGDFSAGVVTADLVGDVTGTVSSISNHDTDSLAEGNTNLYYTSGRALEDANIAISTNTTDNLSEGTGSLYFTDARARNAISAGGDLSYNNTTGIMSFTERTDAEVRGLVSASGDLSYNSTTGVFSVTTYKSADFDTDFGNKTTDSLSEGSNNLYYTTARANSAIDTRVNKAFVDALNVDADTLDGIDSTNFARTDVAETFNSDVTVQGNLTVSGTTTTVNTETINLADNIITLNSNEAGAPSQDAGIEVERGTSTNVSLVWDESADKWTVGTGTFVAGTFEGDLTGDVTGTVSSIANHSTTDLAEGTNLYYTAARFNSAFAGKSTSDLSEGTNLYHTTARVSAIITSDVDKTFVDALAVDAGTLGGQAGSYYRNASNLNAGTIPSARLPDLLVSDFAGAAIQTSAEAFSDSDTVLMTAAAANDRFQIAGSYQPAGSYVTTNSVQALHSTDALSISGQILSLNKADGSSETVTLPDSDSQTLSWNGTNGVLTISGGNSVDLDGRYEIAGTNSVDYINAASFNTTTGVLTLSGVGNAGATVDLDGRYQGAGSYVTTSSAQALRATDAIQVSNDTITLFKGDGTSESVTISDAYENYGSWTISDGTTSEAITSGATLTVTGSGASSVSYNSSTNTLTINSTDTDTNTWRPIDDTPVNGATTESISSNWAYDHENNTAAGVHGSTTTATANRLAHRDASGNLTANIFNGTATAARYADLAEKYATDAELEAGTVVVFGGDAEVTACSSDAHHAVAGVISTDPAYMMNSEAEGQYVALTGRVPVKVTGPVAKGDLMVTSSVAGHAKADNNAQAGRILGKAISAHEGEGEGVVEVLITLM